MKTRKQIIQGIRTHRLLILILTAGLVLRAMGLGFGDPFRYHPDEMKLVYHAGNMLDYHHWSKETLFLLKGYPPFYAFVLAGSFAVYIAGLILSGTAVGLAAVKEYYYLHPFHFHLVGRWLSVICSLFTVLLMYRLGEKLYSRRAGLWAALFFSVSFLTVKHAHFGTVDTLLTLLTTASFYFCVMILKRGGIKDYVAAGVYAGLAIATKYNAGLILLCIVAAHLLAGSWPLRAKIMDRKIWAAALATLLAFLIACPLPLFDTGRFWDSVRGTAEFEQSGKLGSGGGFFSYFTGDHAPGYGFFADNTFPASLGWGLTALFVAGTIYLIWRHRREDILLLLLPLCMYAVIGQMAYKAMRHLLPVVPFLLLIAAELIETGRDRLCRKHNPLFYYVVIFFIAVAPTLIMSWRWGVALFQPDTRTMAKDWIEVHIAAGARIGTEEFAPPLLSVQDLNFEIIRRSADYRAAYDVYGLVPKMFAHGRQRTADHDAAAYVMEHHIQYVILDSYTGARYSWPQSRARYPKVVEARQRFYRWVRENGKMIHELSTGVNEKISPRLQIYEINTGSKAP